MTSPFKRHQQAGFTLLEMIIVIGILLMVTTLIAQIQGSIFRRREDVAQEGNFYNAIRFSLNVLNRDVTHLFSTASFVPQTTTAPTNPNTGIAPGNVFNPNDSSNRATRFWSASADASGIRPSRFQGTENSLSFVTSSHIRIYKGAQESDFAKVVYELKTDAKPSNTPGNIEGSILVRTEAPQAFSDDDRLDSTNQGISKYVLLRGVRTLKFRYWNGMQNRWENTWDSDRDEFKKRYPEAIELTYDVKGVGSLSQQATHLFRAEVPADGLYRTF